MALETIRQIVRRWLHNKQIDRSLSSYRTVIGSSPDDRQKHSDSGTFGQQVDRLFALGDASESSLLEKIARATVSSCLSNTFYKPADFLSDILDLLETRTYLSVDADGEPPLAELEGAERRRKLEIVTRCTLLPIKTACIESTLQHYADVVGKRLAYRSLVAFERSFARLLANIEQFELGFVERETCLLVDAWAQMDEGSRQCSSPSEILQVISSVLHGREQIEAQEHIRLRAPGLPFRIATIVPENREHLLHAAFDLAAHRI